MNLSNQDTNITISMSFYGIPCAIITPLAEFETFRGSVADPKSENFMNSKMRKAIFNKVLKSIKKKDAYYRAHPERMNTKYQAWNDFCDDCVIVTALGSAQYGYPICLIAPETLKEEQNESIFKDTAKASEMSSFSAVSQAIKSLGQELVVCG